MRRRLRRRPLRTRCTGTRSHWSAVAQAGHHATSIGVGPEKTRYSYPRRPHSAAYISFDLTLKCDYHHPRFPWSYAQTRCDYQHPYLPHASRRRGRPDRCVGTKDFNGTNRRKSEPQGLITCENAVRSGLSRGGHDYSYLPYSSLKREYQYSYLSYSCPST